MHNFKLLKQLNKELITGKKFLVRVDLNVPIDENGIVKDSTRINAVLETIKYIINHEGKVILCSHMGRPKGKIDNNLSLRPVSDTLSAKVGKTVHFVDDCIGSKVKSVVKRMSNGDILLLENVRFYKEEESFSKNTKLEEEGNKDQVEKNIEFAKELAHNYDYFVNDAFSVMHRSHASVTGVIQYGTLPCYAGFLVEKELEVLLPLLNPGKNSMAIIGGKKLKDKLGSIDILASKYDKIIVGGVVSNVFLSTTCEVGSSKIHEKNDDTDYQQIAKKLLEKHNNIILPQRVVIAKMDFTERRSIEIRNGITKEYGIFDDIIDRNTLQDISKAKVVVWCGPIGLFEKGFKEGNSSIGKALESNKNGITVIGGGETAEAVGRITVSHISTGGGATLELLKNGTLPGLEALEGKFKE